MRTTFPGLVSTLFFAPLLYSQVAVTGVVSAASWATPIAPSSIVSIFGTNLANTTAAAAQVGGTLAGTSVTFNGMPAQIYYVSPGQINAVVPAVGSVISANIVVTSPFGTSAAQTIPLLYQAPSLFTADSSGCGQAATLNVSPSGAVSVNSPTNSAQPGDSIALFGTGFGTSFGTVLLSGSASVGFLTQPSMTYRGPAPTLPGADQINLLLPAGVQEGCTVPVTVGNGQITGPTLSVSIHSGRGQCVDPPPVSYGAVTLLSTVGGSDTLSAIFPSGPYVQAPPPPVTLSGSTVSGTESRSCTVAGYTNLSAGSIAVNGPGSKSIGIEPQPLAAGVGYQQTLPAGFIGPGSYSVTSSRGSAAFTIGSPIQVQSTFPAGTTLSASQPVTINWTGGDPNEIVSVRFVAHDGPATATEVWQTTAGAGSITLYGNCTSGNPLNRYCLWGVPHDNNAQLIIDVLPPGNGVAAVSGSTSFYWDYRYIFSSLSLTN